MPALVKARGTKQASSKSGKSASAPAVKRKLSLVKGKDDPEEAEVQRHVAANKLKLKGKDREREREREREDGSVAEEKGKTDSKNLKSQKPRQEKTEEKTATKRKIAKRKAMTPSSPSSESSEAEDEDENEEGENEAEDATNEESEEGEEESDEGSKENEEEEEEEDAPLHGFSSESDSSDEDDEDDDNVDKTAPIDVGKLPTVAKDDASVKRKLEKAKKQQVEDRGVLYVGRIPHGFYEDQMKAYFSQFGEVTRLRLSRNKKTGRSKHYAFIEFKSSAVAQIVAETMDNYLLMGHLLQCKLLPKDEVHPELWIGANRKFRKVPSSRVERHHQNKTRTDEEKKRVERRLLKRQKQKKRRLEELGIDYDLNAASYSKKQKQNA